MWALIGFVWSHTHTPSLGNRKVAQLIGLVIMSYKSSPDENAFEARPTNRLGKDHKIVADGDTWQEMMAVCEPRNYKKNNDGSGPSLVIRSYYQNTRTGKRVWDEPPSGATNIIPASEEMRKMATLQLNELHVVETVDNSSKKGPEIEKKKTKGIFGMFQKKKKDNSQNDGQRLIQYRPGSKLVAKPRKGPSRNEIQLQEAIAASIAESRGETYVPVKRKNEYQGKMREEEEMEMAKALSMSEATDQQNYQSYPNQETEEEILARVLEESKLETMKGSRSEDLLGLSNTVSGAQSSWIEDERKMPATKATPSYSIAPSSSTATATSIGSLSTPTRSKGNLKAPPPYSVTPASSSSPPTVAAMFDPYAKDSTAATKMSTREKKKQEASTLKKMDESQTNKHNRMAFAKRKSTKQIQDQAGLV